MADHEATTLNEAIDACRPGSDDASQPEMRALAEAIDHDEQTRRHYNQCQQLDASIGRVMREPIEPPAGLADRLLAAIQENATQENTTKTNGIAAAVEPLLTDDTADIAPAKGAPTAMSS